MKKTLCAALAAALCLSLLSACGPGQAEKQVDLSAFAQTLQQEYEFASYLVELDPDNEYDRELFDNTMPGLLELDLEQRIYLAGMIALNNGEIGLAQAKSPEDAEKVRESFQARIDYMAGDEEEPGGAFYPGPIQLWTNSAQVVVRGNYVLMVVADDGDEIVSRFDALFEQET